MDIHEILSICRQVDTVIWDLDGTLIDSFGEFCILLNKVLRLRGMQEIDRRLLRKHYHGTFYETMTNVFAEFGKTIASSMITQIIQEFHILETQESLPADELLFEDACQLATTFHAIGARQVLVTNRLHGNNSVTGSPRNIVANSRLRPLIHYIVCSDDTIYRKPNPRVLDTIPGSLGKCLVIGDQHVDVELANRMRQPAILLARPGAHVHLDKVTISPSVYITTSLRPLAERLTSG